MTWCFQSILIITANGGIIGCNATTHYAFILLLEPHKVVTELEAFCVVQLDPFGFRTILHLQQQNLRYTRSSGHMRCEMRWCGLHALGMSGICVGSQSVLDSQELGSLFAGNFRKDLIFFPFGDQRRSRSDSAMGVTGRTCPVYNLLVMSSTILVSCTMGSCSVN